MFRWISSQGEKNCTRSSNFPTKFRAHVPRTIPGRIIFFSVFIWGILYRLLGVFVLGPPEASRGRKPVEDGETLISYQDHNFSLWSVSAHGTTKFEGDLSFSSKDTRKIVTRLPAGLWCVYLVETSPNYSGFGYKSTPLWPFSNMISPLDSRGNGRCYDLKHVEIERKLGLEIVFLISEQFEGRWLVETHFRP